MFSCLLRVLIIVGVIMLLRLVSSCLLWFGLCFRYMICGVLLSLVSLLVVLKVLLRLLVWLIRLCFSVCELV